MRKTIVQSLLIVLLTGVGAVAQETAGKANRPLGVPAEYVITPFGYFHPSCVQHVAEGELLLADGRIQHADGSVDTIAPVCDYPRYSPQGSLVAPDGRSTPVTNGWVEHISVTTSASYGKITASWITPPAPSTNNGQTLFFFPGFEDISHVVSIVQPVLQYGSSGAGGGSYWALASWNCCLSGVADYSTIVAVNAGDTIIGSISSTCAPGGNSCSTWNVLSEDKTTGAKTTLSKTPSDGQVWNWAFGAVMEVYNVIQCADYPANTGVTYNVKLYDQNLNLISSPAWTQSPASGINPACGFGLSSTATKETVKYNP